MARGNKSKKRKNRGQEQRRVKAEALRRRSVERKERRRKIAALNILENCSYTCPHTQKPQYVIGADVAEIFNATFDESRMVPYDPDSYNDLSVDATETNSRFCIKVKQNREWVTISESDIADGVESMEIKDVYGSQADCMDAIWMLRRHSPYQTKQFRVLDTATKTPRKTRVVYR